MFYLLSCWLYGALSYASLFPLHRVCVLDMHISLCYCASLNAYLDDHFLCYVIIVVISIWLFLVYDQIAHMFHIMFTLSQFTCYIILVILLLALPWGSNVFCASVSGYKYIYMFQVHHSFSSLWRGETLSTFSLYCLSFYSI